MEEGIRRKMKKGCYTAKHAGGLKECIESELPINYDLAYDLIKSNIYQYYGYDEKSKAHRYLLRNHINNIGLPTWLHLYGVIKIDL